MTATGHHAKELVEEAIGILGSQHKLARAAGVGQQAISAILRGKTKTVTPAMAAKIDRATGGRVPKHKLAPEVFDPPPKEEPKHGEGEEGDRRESGEG